MVELHLCSEAYVYHVNVTFILETLRNDALLSKSPQQNHFRQSKVLIACSSILIGRKELLYVSKAQFVE